MRTSVTLLILAATSPAFAQDVGDTIVVTTDYAELKSASEVVTSVRRGNHLTVERVDGDWYWVEWELENGWIKDQDVVPIDEAIRFFTDAIRLDPNAMDYVARGNLWYMRDEHDIATCPEARYRDGDKAIEYSRQSCELRDWQHSFSLSALAAAYAESGDFDKAVEYEFETIACELYNEEDETRECLEMYEAGRPYRQDQVE